MNEKINSLLSRFQNVQEISPKNFLISSFHTPYSAFLEAQEEMTQLIWEDRELKFFLFMSHPLTLTQGRGDRQNQGQRYQESPIENIPLFDIRRGGGLTLHGPNQLIYYPIQKLNSKSYSFQTHLDFSMELIKEIVKTQFEVHLEMKRCPLGLWHQERKYASFGVQLKKLVTNHGIALNVGPYGLRAEDQELISPCGLSFQQYDDLNSMTGKQLTPEDLFLSSLEQVMQILRERF